VVTPLILTLHRVNEFDYFQPTISGYQSPHFIVSHNTYPRSVSTYCNPILINFIPEYYFLSNSQRIFLEYLCTRYGIP